MWYEHQSIVPHHTVLKWVIFFPYRQETQETKRLNDLPKVSNKTENRRVL